MVTHPLKASPRVRGEAGRARSRIRCLGATRRTRAWTWNVFGLLDLLVALGIGTSVLVGPAVALFGGSLGWLERAALGFQPFGPAIFPVSFPLAPVPTFILPLSVVLHLLSLRKLATEGARARDTAGTARENTSSSALRSHTA